MFCSSIICSVLLALMRLLFVLDNMFSIGKLGTPELAPPGAAMFLFDDLFLPLGTFEDADALWEPVVALKATWLPWACAAPLLEGIVSMAV